MVDLGYERVSNRCSVNSTLKISKMVLLFANPKFKVASSSCLKTTILKVFPGPTLLMVGPNITYRILA